MLDMTQYEDNIVEVENSHKEQPCENVIEIKNYSDIELSHIFIDTDYK